MDFTDLDLQLDLDLDLEEWEEEIKTEPMGLPPLSENTDYSSHPISPTTPCYFCNNLAKSRLKSGQPICDFCKSTL